MSDSRFIELRKITGSEEEPLVFHIRADDRPIISDPRGKEIMLVKASLDLSAPLIITQANMYQYFMLIGEDDLEKNINGVDKPYKKRNRFTSYINNGFYSGNPLVNYNPCRYAILQPGEYSSIEDIVKNIKIWNRDTGSTRTNYIFECHYDKYTNMITYTFGNSRYTDYLVDNYYKTDYIDTFFISSALCDILDPQRSWFKQWVPAETDLAIIHSNPMFNPAFDDNAIKSHPDPNYYLSEYDFVENYQLHMGANSGNFHKVDLNSTFKFDLKQFSNLPFQGDYNQAVSPLNVIVRTFGNRLQEPLYGYPAFAKDHQEYGIDRFAALETIYQLTVPFSGMKNVYRALKMKTRGLNQELTTIATTDEAGYKLESILAHLTLTSDWNIGDIIEVLPQLDLQRYQLIGTTTVSELFVDLFLETVEGIEYPARQSKNAISSIILKVTDIGK